MNNDGKCELCDKQKGVSYDEEMHMWLCDECADDVIRRKPQQAEHDTI